MSSPLAAMVIEATGTPDADNYRVMITQATLAGDVQTVTAKNPHMLESTELLVELLSARAVPEGAVLVVPGELEFAEVHKACHAIGWRHGSTELAERSGWSQLTQRGKPPVILCDRATVDEHPSILIPKGATASTIATLLADYQRVVGAPWYSTGALSGIAALSKLWKARDDTGPHWKTRVDAHLPDAPELHYERELLPDEKHLPLGKWDGRKFGLNAAGVLRVPMGKLEWMPRKSYSYEEPGYWHLTNAHMVNSQIAERFGADFPTVIGVDRITANGGAYLTQPLIDVLVRSWDIAVDVSGVITSDKGWYGFPLRPLAYRIRDAIYGGIDDDSVLGKALKQTYAGTPSSMKYEGGSIYRRDWVDAHEDTMTASILRRIGRVHAVTKLIPARIERDAVYYRAAPEMLDIINDTIGVGQYIGTMRRII